VKIDAHAHGIHAELGPDGKNRVPPLVAAWKDSDGPPEAHVRQHNERGIEKALVLDPVDIAFQLKDRFGDFVLACPQVDMDKSSPEEIASVLDRGACGIKFIAPTRPYGDARYLPLYEVVRDYCALAVFHCGYLTHGFFNRQGLLARSEWIDITHMRPAELDRINRAFPDLKILMAHFGNPWWEEAWSVMKSDINIYADLSGGTAIEKPMDLWKGLFRPNGKLHVQTVSKLCYGADDSMFHAGYFGYDRFIAFYEALYEALALPEEIRLKIDRENILALTSKV